MPKLFSGSVRLSWATSPTTSHTEKLLGFNESPNIFGRYGLFPLLLPVVTPRQGFIGCEIFDIDIYTANNAILISRTRNRNHPAFVFWYHLPTSDCLQTYHIPKACQHLFANFTVEMGETELTGCKASCCLFDNLIIVTVRTHRSLEFGSITFFW